MIGVIKGMLGLQTIGQVALYLGKYGTTLHINNPKP